MMRFVRPAALLVALLALGAAAGSARSAVAAPTGLHAFLLRADEPTQTSFSRTPSFAWNPVRGADHYEFQLSLSGTFRDNSVVYEDLAAQSPVEAPPVTLPWITGNPHSLYARVRAVMPNGATPWTSGFGFDMVPPPAPTALAGYPGLIRWTPVEGALAYQVWLVDAKKIETVTTNELDEREFYTFHQSTAWTGTVRWRVRALRTDSGQNLRANGIPAVQYGPWSTTYSSSNPAPSTGPINLIGTVSDVFSDGGAQSPAHRLMPAFLWTGNQAASGTAVELYRVYVFTDSTCLNRVYTSAVVGSPAYAPRPYGPLGLPGTAAGVTAARNQYLADGTEPASFTLDGGTVAPTESSGDTTPTTSVPGATGQTAGATTSSSSASSSSSGSSSGAQSSGTIAWSGRTGAPIDLWDVGWPNSGYYWTVIPVAAQPAGGLSSNVASSGAKAGDTTLPVTSSNGFNIGDVVTVGTGVTAESVTITGVSDGQLTLSGKFANGHGAGEPVSRTSGNLVYQDLELPQDVCAAGRVMRFGKQSEPSLTSSGELFATGLSSAGRLTSALHTTAFYGQPLVSWTPALGAEAYEVQWSKAQYPFVPQSNPGTGAPGIITTSTATILPVAPGTWWYRVRGFDYSLPSGAQQMSWSVPAKLVVAKPAFKIVAGAPAKAAPRVHKSAAPAAGMTLATGDGFRMDVPLGWQRLTLKDSLATFVYRDPVANDRFHANLNVLRSSGRAGRTFAQWSADLAAELRATIGVAPATGVVTLPAGTAVRLDATVPNNGHPVRVFQYLVDAGSSAYAVTFECSVASYSSHAAAFAKSLASFQLG